MHQVFVSHATEDHDAASRVCEMLEADGIGCWLASRDAIASEDREAEILEAIRSSDLVLLVFSASANASPGVLHEIERAVAYERPVLPVRVDDATPNASLRHYLDLAAQPAAIASPAIASLETAKELEPGPGAEAARPRKPRRRTWVIALISAAAGRGRRPGARLGTRSGPDPTSQHLDRAHPLGDPALGPQRALDGVRSLTGRMIMFGGGGEAASYNDTWAYDPAANTWTELSPPGSPPASRGYALDGVRPGHPPADHVRRAGRRRRFPQRYVGLRPDCEHLDQPQPRRCSTPRTYLAHDGLRLRHR